MNYPDIDYDRINDEYLEQANENFQEAMSLSDEKTCRLIIADLKDKGFTSSAHILEREMNYLSNKRVLV